MLPCGRGRPRAAALDVQCNVFFEFLPACSELQAGQAEIKQSEWFLQSILPEEEVFQRLKIKLSANTKSKLRLEQRKAKSSFQSIYILFFLNATVRRREMGCQDLA